MNQLGQTGGGDCPHRLDERETARLGETRDDQAAAAELGVMHVSLQSRHYHRTSPPTDRSSSPV
jgi:hypothetical protein